VEVRAGTAATGTGGSIHMISGEGALGGIILLETPSAGESGESGGIFTSTGTTKAGSSGVFSVSTGTAQAAVVAQ